MACSARKAANEAGQLMHKQRPFLVEALTAIGLIVAPFVLPHIGFAPNTVNRILVWGLFGLGFDILFGFTGLLSFGQSAFYGTGGFVAAYLLTRAGFPNVMLALIIGMIGYHFLEGMKWIDAFTNASMILSGMGPMGELKTSGGKIFAGCYALFSGVTFLSSVGLIFAPIFHRFLHKFHFESAKEAKEK